MLSVRKIRLAYGGAPLLDEVSFELSAGERVCLVGRNGTGKSSLLEIVAGIGTPDDGEVQVESGGRRSFLPQAIPDLAGSTREVIASGLEGEPLAEWDVATRVDRLLEEMELEGAAPAASLSAGMKRRVLLARALASDPDLLILDEPTNHLDLPAIRWMEAYLRDRFRGSLLFVTHDRAFLQALATRILDLDRGRLTSWDCDYPRYLERKAAWLEGEARREAEFDRKLAEEERWIRRGIQARRTRNEGRVRALKQMRQEHAARRNKLGTVELQIAAAEKSGAKVIAAEGVTFGYGARCLVRDFSCLIERGDRVGIVGPNGAGKTTLLRLLLGEIVPHQGRVEQGTRLEIAYFDQLRNQLDPARTVFDTVADGREAVTLGGRTKHVMSYLQDFLFPPDRARSTVGMLSGGERNRLLLARLFTQPANLLVLDEPTNDLDLETLDLLEERLAEFPGTVLAVSHDRAFLDEVVTDLLVLAGDGTVQPFVGGYTDWLARLPAPRSAPPAGARSGSARGQRPPKARRFLNRERWELEALPGEIEALEAEQAQIASRLADPKLYQESGDSVPGLQARHDEIEGILPGKYERWEELETLRRELEEGS